MALDPSNSSNLEQLALKGLIASSLSHSCCVMCRATVSAQRGLLSFSMRVSVLFIIQLWHELPVETESHRRRQSLAQQRLGPQYFGMLAYLVLITQCSLVLLSSPLTNSQRQPQIVYYWPRTGVVLCASPILAADRLHATWMLIVVQLLMWMVIAN